MLSLGNNSRKFSEIRRVWCQTKEGFANLVRLPCVFDKNPNTSQKGEQKGPKMSTIMTLALLFAHIKLSMFFSQQIPLPNSVSRTATVNSWAVGVVSNTVRKIMQFFIRLFTISHEVYLRSRSEGSEKLKKIYQDI